MELSETVRDALANAVEVWANENLEGKPALLANCMYISLEKRMIEQAEEIAEHFPNA